MIELMEKAITERLKAKLPKQLLVDGFPDDAQAYKSLPWSRGVVLVVYKGSDFAEPTTMGLVVQERAMQWEVQLRTKDLRTHTGAYPHLDAIRAALTGFRPGPSGPLYPVRETFVAADDHFWTYALVFACKAQHLEVPEEIPEPPMTRATFLNPTFGYTVEIPNDEA